MFSNIPEAAGTKLAASVSYCGSAYSGWQAQPHLPVSTVQTTLENALRQVAAAPVRVHCAGRTDTGVHATSQIVHFTAPSDRSPKSWVMGTNANLPPDIRLNWVVPVDEAFHARFSATARRYYYVIANTVVRPAQMRGQLTWCRHELDASAMHEAAQAMLGERDFSAFRAASCQSHSPMRNVHAVKVWRRGDLVVVDIQANAFLHHMVRNIAGSLMMVGRGQQAVSWIGELLAAGDRRRAADTAAPDGLYLVGVDYPPQHPLPQSFASPIFL